MSRAQMRSDGLCRVCNKTQIWLVILVERGGDADNDGVHLSQARILRGGLESTFLGRLNIGRRNAKNVRASLVQSRDLTDIDIKTGDGEFLFGVEQSQRQTYVAESDDGDTRLFLLNLVL